MAATFLTCLAGGMLVVLALGRVEAVAYRFVRVVGAVAFGVVAAAGVWVTLDDAIEATAWPIAAALLTGAAGIAAAAVMVLASVMDVRPQLFRWAGLLGGTCGVAAGCAWAILAAQPKGWLLVMLALGQVAGALLLGSVTVAWLLGHAYLTATTMTIVPLRRLSRMFLIAIALRWMYLAACVALLYFGLWSNTPPGVALVGGEGVTGSLSSVWLILTVRVSVGLLVTSLFAYMVADCVRLRSTQSATGILYFASVFVYIGELSSQHLAIELGLPI